MDGVALETCVARSVDGVDQTRFAERVRDQAATVADAIAAGRFDNHAFTVGLELEGYVVDADGRIVPVPDAAFEHANKELGVHNVEINTPATAFDAGGIATQRDAVRRSVDGVGGVLEDTDGRFVLDGMWTVPPAVGSEAYLAATEERDGLTVASNMRENARYYALDRDIVGRTGGPVVELPGVRLELPTIMAEALTTSMQPHLQIPDAGAFPRYFNTAIRTLGPVLALGTNSPFLPADLYDPTDDPAAVVGAAHHESRIAVFEQSINAESPGKVRVPRDLERPADVAHRLAEDATRAPFLREWVTDEPRRTFADEIWELTHKRGTYWRWVRGVIGGAAVEGATGERSLRIEYRPVPTQPSVLDTVGLQAVVAGLLRGLLAADHPLVELPWEAARDSFYGVAEVGLDAELAWVTADGRRTEDHDVIFGELFEYARRGLREQGLAEGTIATLLDPIVARWKRGRTPSRWKKDRVSQHLDAGHDLRTAIERMQTEYIELATADRAFAEWPAPDAV